MIERPIIFRAPMVRAILEGRKTQTRRLITQPLEIGEDDTGKPWPVYPSYVNCGYNEGELADSPYGFPGDRLWVRESFQKCGCDACRFVWPKRGPHGIAAFREGYRGPSGAVFNPSIFMPRWASRITLEITDVRFQRVQEISEEDALTEGIWPPQPSSFHEDQDIDPAVVRFASLWDEINFKRGFGWNTNPWVWALTFRRIT